MTTPIVKSLIDEQVESLTLAATLGLPRSTLICNLPSPVKGAWAVPGREDVERDNGAFMQGDWGYDERGRMVEL